MKYTTTVLIGLGMAPILCLATTIQDPRQRLLLDRISMKAAELSLTGTTALELLKLVALGRTQEISTELEVKVGLTVGQLRQKEFSSDSIRSYAFQKIGETDLPDALEFLATLKRNDIGVDSLGQVWLAAHYALANTLLNRIADPQLRIQFLERTVTDRGPAINWAAEQLCNGGPVASLALVEKYLREIRSDQYGEDEIRFCEARMQVIARSPDRINALGSVLSANTGSEQDRLVKWAIYQLAEMGSSMADAELKRFMTEIERLPDGSPRKQRLSAFKGEINSRLRHEGQTRSPWQ